MLMLSAQAISLLCSEESILCFIILRRRPNTFIYAVVLICQWRANQLFNNRFIIRSRNLFSYFNHSLTAQGNDAQNDADIMCKFLVSMVGLPCFLNSLMCFSH